MELFPASDGSLYLLRSGSRDDFVVAKPTPRDRVLLELLADGFQDEASLRDALKRRELGTGKIDECIAQLEELGLIERSGAEDLLPPRQAQRYDRQLIYFSDLAEAGTPPERLQRRLGEATVVVLGCGGLGSWAACGLACAGIGSLVLVDHDRVELSNLNRQLLFSEADVGELKVEAAARALLAHNSELHVTPVCRQVGGSDDLTDSLVGVDLLIATADWPPYELQRWVNRACLAARVPYISAGQFLPLVRIGPMVLPGRSACLECLERQTRREFPLYRELSARRSPGMATAATLGPASGVIGSMLAMEAIHLLVGPSRPASVDRAVILDLRSLRLTQEAVRRDPTCPLCADQPLDEDPGRGTAAVSHDREVLERLFLSYV